MGVAYTNGPITYRSLRGDTVAHLLADLHTALTAVNWISSAMTGGYIYTVTSPQGLKCAVRIYDAGDGHVTVQFVSLDETHEGYLHKLAVGTTYNAVGYRLLANQCQMFVALHGITNETLSIFERNYDVAGGIPYVPMMGTVECSDSAGPVNTAQLFWSCGQTNNDDFRTARFCSGIFTTCANGVINVATGTGYNPGVGTLQLYPFTMTEDTDAWWRTLPRILKYGSGEPMHLDPYIGWEFGIVGQLWDAFLVSRDTILEQVLAEDGFNWLAWNYGLFLSGRGGGGTYFATLYLLLDNVSGSVDGVAGAAANYAY